MTAVPHLCDLLSFTVLNPDLQPQCFSALTKISIVRLLKYDRILPNVTIDGKRSLNQTCQQDIYIKSKFSQQGVDDSNDNHDSEEFRIRPKIYRCRMRMRNLPPFWVREFEAAIEHAVASPPNKRLSQNAWLITNKGRHISVVLVDLPDHKCSWLTMQQIEVY